MFIHFFAQISEVLCLAVDQHPDEKLPAVAQTYHFSTSLITKPRSWNSSFDIQLCNARQIRTSHNNHVYVCTSFPYLGRYLPCACNGRTLDPLGAHIDVARIGLCSAHVQHTSPLCRHIARHRNDRFQKAAGSCDNEPFHSLLEQAATAQITNVTSAFLRTIVFMH